MFVPTASIIFNNRFKFVLTGFVLSITGYELFLNYERLSPCLTVEYLGVQPPKPTQTPTQQIDFASLMGMASQQSRLCPQAID